MTTTYDSVGNKATTETAHVPKNLARTTCPSERGRVNNNSSVPCLCSSANDLIVTAGTRNIKIHGASAKKLAIEAIPLSRMFQVPGKIHKNRPVNRRNTATTVYPIKELKKLRISFKTSALIGI